MPCSPPSACAGAQRRHMHSITCTSLRWQQAADLPPWRQRQQRWRPGPAAAAAGRQPSAAASWRCQAADADGMGSWDVESPVLSDDDALSSWDDASPRASPGSGAASPSSSGGSSRNGSSSGGSMARDRWRVPLPPHLHGKAPRKHWNANALAFLGDSVWEVRGVWRGWPARV